MKILRSCLLLGMLPISAFAQSQDPADTSDSSTASTSPWRLGVGVIATDHAYLGQGTQITPFPLVDYEGQRFFFRGITGGAHLLHADGFTVDAIVTTGFNNIDAHDFSRSDLARRGIDRGDLQDRKRSIDAGFAATWSGSVGQLKAQAKSDISGNSEGQEYSLEYAYPMHFSGFTIAPAVGATFLSSKVADYYYGIHPAEERRGVAPYTPGGSLIPDAAVSFMKPLGSKWAVTVTAKYTLLPNKISNSPLIGADHGSTIFVGISRSL